MFFRPAHRAHLHLLRVSPVAAAAASLIQRLLTHMKHVRLDIANKKQLNGLFIPIRQLEPGFLLAFWTWSPFEPCSPGSGPRPACRFQFEQPKKRSLLRVWTEPPGARRHSPDPPVGRTDGAPSSAAAFETFHSCETKPSVKTNSSLPTVRPFRPRADRREQILLPEVLGRFLKRVACFILSSVFKLQ